MRQDFKGKGIKGVILLELTTRRDPEGCRAESHRRVGAFYGAVFFSLPLQRRWGSGMVETRGRSQNGHG